MDKDLRRYIIEIIIMTLFTIIIIPICVNASNEYNKKQTSISNGSNTLIDVTNKLGNIKQINLSNISNEPVKVKLGIKITNFYDEYIITIDTNTYNLNEIEYSTDGIYRYYILGTYELTKEKNIDFELKVKDKNYYDESITYSFYTEGII